MISVSFWQLWRPVDLWCHAWVLESSMPISHQWPWEKFGDIWDIHPESWSWSHFILVEALAISMPGIEALVPRSLAIAQRWKSTRMYKVFEPANSWECLDTNCLIRCLVTLCYQCFIDSWFLAHAPCSKKGAQKPATNMLGWFRAVERPARKEKA